MGFDQAETVEPALAPEGLQAAAAPAPRRTNWLQRLFSRQAELTDQLALFSEAIEDEPDAAANYVLRAEVLVELGEIELARTDFEAGLRLAEEALEVRAWGIVAQALRDRALAGLEQLDRRGR